ncbi:MAG: decaprenyl-phosphate phosphoribosyltransferase [Granulosicoccus sp.]|jgi:decaprenyl-phosphate phosphoribosyltransferase
MKQLSSILELIRPKHWVKNLFVMMPLFFAGQVQNQNRLIDTVVAMVAFCLVASAVYVVNDLKDAKADRKHPEKKKRPIASGAVKKGMAGLISIILLAASIAIALSVSREVAMGLGLYFLMNLAYTFGLKKVSILDVSIIATGFVIRVLVGGSASDVHISHWIIIDTFLLALILALSKRRAELNLHGKNVEVRQSLKGYNEGFLDLSLVLFSGVTIVSYIMYCVSDEVMNRLDSELVYLTAIFVMLGLMRYLQQIIVNRSTKGPVQMLYSDGFLLLVVVAWAASFVFILY